MDAEKLALQQRVDNLQEHIDSLHGVITDYERQNAKLKAELEAELEAVKRERDALKHDFLSLACEGFSSCYFCKHFKSDEALCKHTIEIGAEDIDDCFEWRGLCAGNGGKEDGKRS